MSGPNSRKRAAPGAAPSMPAFPQQMQQPYGAGNSTGDQIMRWGGTGDVSAFMDGGAGGANPYELAQYSQPSNSLVRRQMDALVPANPRTNFDPSGEPWAGFVGDEAALMQQNPPEEIGEHDNIEVLEELAQKAKRDAQGKRKAIPPFVQKLSRYESSLSEGVVVDTQLTNQQLPRRREERRPDQVVGKGRFVRRVGRG
jgi:heat shock transcription factor, other eukaryote